MSFAREGTWLLGAPDVVSARRAIKSSSPPPDRATDAHRRLLLARASGPIDRSALPSSVIPIALIVLTERLRPDAARTIRYLSEQQVKVTVLSGDAPETVKAVADRVGIRSSGEAKDASALDDASLANALETCNVFGRVRPDQKLAAVRELQAGGHVVAMVGDGLNDV